METLQNAVPANVRNILQHAVQTLRAQVGPEQLSPDHLNESVAILMEEFYPVVPPEPLPAHAADQGRNHPGISINATRAVFGALLRIAAELNLLAFKNAADLCRRIAPGVTTLGFANLPAESLLRAFRYPTTAAYRKVQQICMRIIDYIKVNRLAE